MGAATAFAIAAVATSIVSVHSQKQADKSAKRADRALDANTRLLQQKYEDWKAVFGTVETNLGNYFSSLKPEEFAARGIQNYEEQHKNALDRVRQNYARLGISDSGQAIGAETDLEVNRVINRAKIEQNAEHQVAGFQQDFLQLGYQDYRRSADVQASQTRLEALLGQSDRDSSNANAALRDLFNVGIQAAGSLGNNESSNEEEEEV